MRFIRWIGIVMLWGPLQADLLGQDRLLWEDRKDFSGGSDAARAVTARGDTVVAAGIASVPGGLDFVVRGYDAASGGLRWSDRKPAFAGLDSSVFVSSLGAAVYAAADTPVPGRPDERDIFVRAYEARTGAVLWDDVFDRGRDDTPQALASGEAAVVVAGYGGDAAARRLHALVRAYHPVTGAIRWEDSIDPGDHMAAAWAVAIQGARVYVAGAAYAAAGPVRFVRAYDATGGALLWEVAGAGGVPAALAAAPGRVFIAGDGFIEAREAADGGLVWRDVGPGNFFDARVRERSLVAVGSSGPGRGSLVRVYDVITGELGWEHATTPAPGLAELFHSVDVTGGAVYAAGGAGEDFTYSETLVRAYDLRRGTVLFENRARRSALSHLFEIVVWNLRAFVAGVHTSANGDGDFLVRALEVCDVELGIEPSRRAMRRPPASFGPAAAIFRPGTGGFLRAPETRFQACALRGAARRPPGAEPPAF